MKLFENIKHGGKYDAGGIATLYLLPISEFHSYVFRNDGLFDTGYAEQIKALEEYTELDVTSGSTFKETSEKGIYKQELTTFVRTLDSHKLSILLKATTKRFLVTFKTYDDRAFTFGSDGGATLSFSQQTGQIGDSTGYSITLTKSSIYPLIETALDQYNKKPVWILETGLWNDEGLWIKDGIFKTK